MVDQEDILADNNYGPEDDDFITDEEAHYEDPDLTDDSPDEADYCPECGELWGDCICDTPEDEDEEND
jgi:hypothetical protein